MNCQIVINSDSGNAAAIDLSAVAENYTDKTDNVTFTYIKDGNWQADGFDKVIVCGGDGTLHGAVNKLKDTDKILMYLPCGTLNEKSHDKTIKTVGKINSDYFTYVAATGSFTEIGYNTPDCDKKKFKALAYFFKVLKYYKVHSFGAKIEADGKTFDINATLLMFLQGERCFGFRFNKMYDGSDRLYLLAVSSYGKDSLFNRIRLFFPLFRIFFMKLRRPMNGKRILFIPVENVKLTLQEPRDFCLDGEKAVYGGTVSLSAHSLSENITVIGKKSRRKKKLFNSQKKQELR